MSDIISTLNLGVILALGYLIARHQRIVADHIERASRHIAEAAKELHSSASHLDQKIDERIEHSIANLRNGIVSAVVLAMKGDRATL